MLSREQIERLLQAALASCDLGGEFAVVLEGSIAEGFGNPSSDVDFLVITTEEERRPLMPSVMFIHDRRVEVRFRSAAGLRDGVATILAHSAAGRDFDVPEDDLNRLQRFARAQPLRRVERLAPLQALVDDATLRRVVAQWFAARARNAARYVVASLALGELGEAAGWLTSATLMGAKAWAARRGETYLEPKWISRQLERLDAPAALRARVQEALTPGANATLRAVEDGLGLLAELEVDGWANDAALLSLARVPTATTWRFGARTHVLRAARDLFVFDDEAAALWRTLPFAKPFDELLRVVASPAERRLVGELERLGLVRFRWQDGEALRSDELTPPPRPAQLTVTLEGAQLDEPAPAAIRLVPMAPPRFGAAGMALVWQCVLVENAREDAIGARAAGQWGVLRACLARIVRHAHLALLSARGVQPLPLAEHALERALHDPECRALAMLGSDIERTPTAGPDDAARALGRVDRFLAELRRVRGGVVFPSSFESADDWQRTLDLGHDWVRFGAYVDGAFPIEEARDLLARR